MKSAFTLFEISIYGTQITIMSSERISSLMVSGLSVGSFGSISLIAKVSATMKIKLKIARPIYNFKKIFSWKKSGKPYTTKPIITHR